MSWPFEVLISRLPDEPVSVLELGAPSGLVIPREIDRVIIDRARHDLDGAISVVGDIEHGPTLENAVDMLTGPVLILSAAALATMPHEDSEAILSHLIWDLGHAVGVIAKTRQDRSWRLSGDPASAGLVATVVDHNPSGSEQWALYARP